MFDLVIRGGRIVDGTGNPWFRSDIGIVGDRIIAVGRLSEASALRVIDVHDAIVCPGFIDVHTHSDFSLGQFPRAESLTSQGVTTEVVGNCGLSPHPVNPAFLTELQRYTTFLGGDLDWSWTSTSGFLDFLGGLPLAHDVLTLVGHGSIRIAAMGFTNRAPNREELHAMKRYLAEALEAGAFGLSTGLIYAPGSYADTEELVELCGVVADYGGVYATHLRDEASNLLPAVEEALEIGRRAGVPVHISHHKVMGRANWGLVAQSLQLIDAARRAGLDVTLDQYPYTGSSTTFAAYLPPWVMEGGVSSLLEQIRDENVRRRIHSEVSDTSWENVIVAGVAKAENKRFEGKTIAEMAQGLGISPLDAGLDLMLADGGPFSIVRFGMSDDDVRLVLGHPHVMVASDGLAMAPTRGGKPHPRSYGTFPRVLGRYVGPGGVVSLEDGIRKMTSLPAQRFGLWDRGVIRPNMRADICILDQVVDAATFDSPHAFAKGIQMVFVRGAAVWDHGEDTGASVGRVLRSGRRAWPTESA